MYPSLRTRACSIRTEWLRVICGEPEPNNSCRSNASSRLGGRPDDSSSGSSPITIARQLYQHLPNAQLKIIQHAGHVSNMERPDEFNVQVRRFLQ